jgi:hypothetical protein
VVKKKKIFLQNRKKKLPQPREKSKKQKGFLDHRRRLFLAHKDGRPVGTPAVVNRLSGVGG